MRAFAVPEATATLVLDAPYVGAEVEVRIVGVSSSVYFGLQQWVEQAADVSVSGADRMAAVRELCVLFAQHGLVGWNLTHGSEPISATADGLLSLDPRLLFAVIAAWLGQIGKVAVPLPEASTDGLTDPARPSTPPPGSTVSSWTAASPQR